LAASTSFLYVTDLGLRALLYSKFGDILNLESVNKGVIISPKEIALREMAEKRGVVELEFINIWRTRTAPSWDRQRTPTARRGMTMGYTNANQTDIDIVKAMAVDLSYEVWFWTHDRDKLNLIAERYLFWQHSNPNLNINYTVNRVDDEGQDIDSEAYPIELDMHFGEMVDESTISRKFEEGTMHIMRVPISIDGWVFAYTTVKSIQSIHVTWYDQDSITDYEEIIVEDSNQDTEMEETLRLRVEIIT